MTDELPNFVKIQRHYESLSTKSHAELRHVAKPEDVELQPALYRLFPGQKPDDRHLRFAFLLPWAKHSPKAKSLGTQLAGEISQERILQMARFDKPMDIIQLRRILIQIEPVLDWSKFGKTVWYWGDRAKRKIVHDFYIALSTTQKGEKK